MVFPGGAPPVAAMAVSLSAPLGGVAVRRTGLPLSPHSNPRRVSLMEQSRRFPRRRRPCPSLCCSPSFSPHRRIFGRVRPSACIRRSRLGHFKAGYTAPSTESKYDRTAYTYAPSAGSHPSRKPTGRGPRTWVSAGGGPRPHAIADRPAPLTPSTNHRLGVVSQHQGLHRCALDGSLGPSSGTAAPTRILRHPSSAYHYTMARPAVQGYGTGAGRISRAKAETEWLEMAGVR